MKYVHLENNKILGYYSEEINPVIPSGCLEITEKQWQEALSINANWYENGVFSIKDLMTDKEKEELRVNLINIKTESIIIVPYPIYKQLNIRGLLTPYTMQDVEVMNMYIDSVRGIGRRAKESTITVDEINWGGLDEYTSHDEITKDAIVQIRQKLNLN